jgi:hypothetical protein
VVPTTYFTLKLNLYGHAALEGDTVSCVSWLGGRPVGRAFFGQRGIGDSGPGI